MILLLGGTTEGKEVAGWLADAGLPFLYSTKSKVTFEEKGECRYGPLNAAEMEKLCRDHQIKKVINASHPFAAELHKTVAELAPFFSLIRYERLFPERVRHPLVKYVDDYYQVLQLLEKQEISSLLVLSGVQSVPRLKSFWEKKTCWFRILDRQESIDYALFHGFPAGNLLLGYPQEKEKEMVLFRKLNPQAILSKESGFNGKLSEKTEAALSCGIPIYILKKPPLPEGYQLVHCKEDLFKLLAH